MSASFGEKVEQVHWTLLGCALVLAAACILFAAGPAWALDCPHSAQDQTGLGYGDCTLNAVGCSSCHLTHGALGDPLTPNSDGNSNLCISCHSPGNLAAAKPLADGDRADPYGASGESPERTDFRGTSHAWGVDAANAAAGAVSPSNSQMAARLDNGKITCSVCHDQHNHKVAVDGDAYPFLRISNAGSALCRNCHTGRVDDTSPYSTHPVGVAIPDPATNPYKNPTTLQLESNLVECLTCHSPHYADSGGANGGAGNGWILDMAYQNICFDCHDFPTSGSHFNATTGALWPSATGGSFTGTSDYARSDGTNLFPRDATAGSLSQPLPASFRGTCFNCHWPHGWQGSDKMVVESNSQNLCFTCHDGTVATTPNMWEKFNPTNVTSSQGTYTTGGVTYNQVHDPAQVSCPNCHNPHYVTAANKVMRPDDTTQAWTTNYGVTNTYTYLDRGNPVTVRYDDNLGAANTNDPVNPETGQGGNPAVIGAATCSDTTNTPACLDDTGTSGSTYNGTGDLTYTVTVTQDGLAGAAQVTTTASTADDCSVGNPCNPVTVSAFNSPVAVGNFGLTISFDDADDSPGIVGAATDPAPPNDDTATSGGSYGGASSGTYTVRVSTGGPPGGSPSIGAANCTAGGGCDDDTATSGGTYSGTASINYIVTVTAAGSNGSAQVSVTTSGPGAPDNSGPHTWTSGVPINIGSRGVAITISDNSGQKTLALDEQWTIIVTVSPSAAITVTSDVGDSSGPTDVLGFGIGNTVNVGSKGVTIYFTDGGTPDGNLNENEQWTIAVTAGVPGELALNEKWDIAVTAGTACGLPPWSSTPCVQTDYVAFCLACHDGDPPTTLPASAQTILTNMTNIAAAFDSEQHGRAQGNTGTTLSKGWKKEPWTDQTAFPGEEPRKPYAALQCVFCHDAHGSDNLYHLRSSITIAGRQMTVGGVPGGPFPDPASWSKHGDSTYYLPCAGGNGDPDCANNPGGAQQLLRWGGWCSFCHSMSIHTTSANDTSNCNTGHVHSGSNF